MHNQMIGNYINSFCVHELGSPNSVACLHTTIKEALRMH